MARAASTSSFGAAASIIASAAFIESSEMPPQGERDADCIWNKLALTKSLDTVPSAAFRRFHQFALSPSGGCTCSTLPSARNTLTRTGERRRWASESVGELLGLFIVVYPSVANDRMRDRSHLRSAIASAVQFPVRKLPFL